MGKRMFLHGRTCGEIAVGIGGEAVIGVGVYVHTRALIDVGTGV